MLVGGGGEGGKKTNKTIGEEEGKVNPEVRCGDLRRGGWNFMSVLSCMYVCMYVYLTYLSILCVFFFLLSFFLLSFNFSFF